MSESLTRLAQWMNVLVNDVFFAVVEPLLIILAGLLIARLVSRVITRVSGELDVEQGLERFVKKKFSVTDVVRQATSVFIVVSALVVALRRAHVLRTVVEVGGVVVGGVIGVAALLKLADVLLEYVAYRQVSLPDNGGTLSVGCVSGSVARKTWLCVEVEDGRRRVRVPYRYVRRHSD